MPTSLPPSKLPREIRGPRVCAVGFGVTFLQLQEMVRPSSEALRKNQKHGLLGYSYIVQYRQFTLINFCYLFAPIFRGEFRIIYTNNHMLKKNPSTANFPKNLHLKNEVILWPLTSKIIVFMAQPVTTDGHLPGQ